MVQRTLGIQAPDSIKPEKRLGSFKPSSSHQHQDWKNKGADLKIKMKKCRSIKLSDKEGLRSSFSSLLSPSRKTIAQPGKPPPLNNNVEAAAVTSQKKPMIKAALDGSPNYMKSTSSSEAKKETSPVSSSRKHLRRRSSIGSKTSSASSSSTCDRPARTLVRTLTKSPSFKPARASVKKGSRVATCSSTLKDSKFPSYLMLNPGGTKSEGTSIIKVCPYTYCSLNGHHHAALPPLKCFLKAKRRSLKIQRSVKMEAFSPRRKKSTGDGNEEFDMTASNGVDLDMIKPSSPLMPLDFFIEIYSKSKENDAEESRGSSLMKAKGTNDSVGCGNETAPEHDNDKPVSESLSEGSPQSEIDFDENPELCDEINCKVYMAESSPWKLSAGDEQECVSSIGEVIDMEWEEEGVSVSTLNIVYSSEVDRNDFHEELVISSDESDISSEEILAISSMENRVHETVNEASEADSPKEVPQNSCTIDLKDEASGSTEKFQLDSFDNLEHDETNEDYEVNQKPGDSEADQAVAVCDFCHEKEVPSAEGGDEMEAGKVADAELFMGIKISDAFYVLSGEDEVDNKVEDNQFGQVIDESFSTQDAVEESFFADHLSDCLHENTDVKEDQDKPKFVFHTSMDSKEQNSSRSRTRKTSLAEDRGDAGKTVLEDNVTQWMDAVETYPAASDKSSYKPRRSSFSFSRSNAKEEQPDNHTNRRWTIGNKRLEEKYEESRAFNPREPNFLPVVPGPDAEKVDLRHQMMDERKNAEEWMLDHALQQAVTKLAPARKRKVALLVEAFETVLPISKCETRLRHTSTGFAHHGRPVQACN